MVKFQTQQSKIVINGNITFDYSNIVNIIDTVPFLGMYTDKNIIW